MLYPPQNELKDSINSKYLVVTTAAKRARELQENPDSLLLDEYRSLKNVGQALEEIAAHKVYAKLED
ncbi:DNA-directed RNA polymerase subunit omega [Mammaliicoccus sciuri]|jgi:DNA-directed RNA polymerase subunit omega|uniref:DNA-directed RNA polymerase subunit omega n=1 Tax=Mammaliicoccus sciuri TaxID=1296 RepID=A0AAI8DIK0_MAMSC|nr:MULTISPECIES: DNA-directed RNA polymerase subunit omega [Mammaliicoccus]OOV37446.1 DNA-directed RNA polymerase subunit omega [Staphylococcus sp. MB371]PCQ21010.1 DNA-directed RNA polymerase subunit omega [Klebsiella pneumoniae]ASE34432.1 DNA-directed RNA polymerase subunit omega [Mammaliicoccus sciuri]KTT79808.1 DNA-directed RNA polymerase subunit omega [Mammaliicoccus sciuri]KTT82351.1 DNA-directed RNA polymerase subunit omega [Mammaliicoccus sciuri]